MAWKKIIICITAVLLMCGCTQQTALAYDIYGGNVPESVVYQFQRILAGVSPMDDYLVFCSSENEYIMLVGDIEKNGNIFTGDSGKEYKIVYSSDSGFSSYNVSDVTIGSVNVSDYLVYSNLGDFPMLEERGDLYEMFALITLLIGFLCMLLRSIFQFNLRSRRL